MWPYHWFVGGLGLCKQFTNAFSASVGPLNGLKSANVAVLETFVAGGGRLIFVPRAPPLCSPALRTADEFLGDGPGFVGKR